MAFHVTRRFIIAGALVAFSLLGKSAALAQAPSLQEMIESEYKVTRLDQNPIVPGTVLVVQTADIVGVHWPRKNIPSTMYRNGLQVQAQLTVRARHNNDLGNLSKGDGVYIRSIRVNPEDGWVTLSIIQCGACTGAPPPGALQSTVRLEFSVGELPSLSIVTVEDSIGKVLNTYPPAEAAKPQSGPPTTVTEPPTLVNSREKATEEGIPGNAKSPLPPGVYSVGGDVTPPIPVYQPDAPMTGKAKRAGLSGTMLFQVTIDSRGKVVNLVQTSPAFGMGMDEVGIATLRSWKFKPAKRNGEPVSVRVMVELSFKNR